jgi:putative membrane protein
MQIKTSVLAAFILLSLILFSLAVPGQGRAETSSSGAFVNSAAAAGSFEIMSSNLALTLSSNADVKSFARMMVEDHTKVADELKSIVPGLKVKTMDETLDKQEISDLERLKTESGAAFDKDYISLQVKGHRDAVKLFGDYAQSGDNARLKKFAAANLPTLKHHLEEAETLKAGPGM